MIRPFKVNLSDDVLFNIRKSVAEYQWGYMPDDGGWDYGTNIKYLKELCDYWVNEFDWREQERKMNKFSQFTASVDGMNIHYIHIRGSSAKPRPLLISHGWPGSVAEFLDLLEPLAFPELYGGKSEDAFDLIVPSLPGFGFSDRPKRPMGPRAMAKVLNSLMTDVLGYDDYLAQGGDWGSAICSWLGHDYADHCKAIHINFPTMRHIDGPQDEEEQAWSDRVCSESVMEDGYRTLQATRPQTLSYAMQDNPVAIAAWIVEKFYSWSDLDDGDIESVHSKDDMLTNIMIYVATGTFNSSTWIYYGRREEGGRILGENGSRVEVPTGAALFPKETLAWPPRKYSERMYNIKSWTVMERGGHFAAMEQPKALMADIQQFFRGM
ncbi:epoxide hydrolase family protein [Vibrio amylolyticus]|uniref:epoxide hydrolase family protein n=1 Tax=Vibrio amylolyticus TaxID=2847292 RepID=UPI0035525C79